MTCLFLGPKSCKISRGACQTRSATHLLPTAVPWPRRRLGTRIYSLWHVREPTWFHERPRWVLQRSKTVVCDGRWSFFEWAPGHRWVRPCLLSYWCAKMILNPNQSRLRQLKRKAMVPLSRQRQKVCCYLYFTHLIPRTSAKTTNATKT